MLTVAAGVALFVSTNVDDILVLAAFFADPRFAPRSIVAGQFLGIGALVAASAAAAVAALAVPSSWITALGVIPLALGLRALWQLLTGSSPAAESVHRGEHAVTPGTRSQALAVAAVTIANGGDNLAVYIPVFARDPVAIPLYAAVFAVLTAAWCAAGYAFINNPVAGRHARRYGRLVLPFVLIGLGFWILSG